MKDLYIFGAGKFAHVLFSLLTTEFGRGNVLYGTEAFNMRSLFLTTTFEDGSLPYANRPRGSCIIPAIGYRRLNKDREKVHRMVQGDGHTLVSAIWGTSGPVFLCEGQGNVILPGNDIQPYTVFGRGNVFWSNNHIGHHSKIGDYNFLASGITVCGSVTIGDRNFIGAGAVIPDGAKIGNDCIIGAGTLCPLEVPDNSVVMRQADRVSVGTAAKLSRIL